MSHTRDEWKSVVRAVESAVPLYESISETISAWLAHSLRRTAVTWLDSRTRWTLDLGVGPGVSSRLLLSEGFQSVVGLDPSRKLLEFARSRLGPGFHPIIGVSENFPFRSGSFGGVLTCFALRDVRNLRESLREISRVSAWDGKFALVDVGKPDMAFLRELVWLYVRYGMPIVARLLIRNRIRGNPFRMIIPTFERLATNRVLLSAVAREVGPSKLREFMFGGLVIVLAERERPSNLGQFRKSQGKLAGGRPLGLA